VDGSASEKEGAETGTVSHVHGLIPLSYYKGKNFCGKPAVANVELTGSAQLRSPG